MSARDEVLLLAGSGDEQYRGYLVASAAHRCRLWLVDSEQPTWQRAYISGATTVDVFDPAALVAAVLDLSRTVTVLGILCYHEGVILAAAHAAAALGVPGMGVDAVHNCRDKARTRRLLTAAGIAQPRFALVSSPTQAAKAATSIGFPLVLKPRNLGASQGVVRIDDESDIDAAFDASRSASQHGMTPYPDLLMEEYIEGPEVSVDAAVHDGIYQPLFLARKRVGAEPYFEETGHIVSARDPLLADRRVVGVLAAAHSALGARHGITHTELKLTPRGPVLIEVNGRLGGDLIPYLGHLATGIDPGHVAVDVATGRAPRTVPSRAASAGIRFLYPPYDAILRHATLPAQGECPGLHRAALLENPGTALRLPPAGYVARYAYLIAAAGDPATCERRLDAAETRVLACWNPLPGDDLRDVV
jgi:predicted ATP-grasp superfamily ATP-dependent carboligase